MTTALAFPERSRTEVSLYDLVLECLNRGDEPTEIWASLEALIALSEVSRDHARTQFTRACTEHKRVPKH